MKNSLKKVTASVVALMFAIGLSLVAASPASAEGITNNDSYWQTSGTSEVCEKTDDPGGTTWLLSSVSLPAGSSWTKVIVKAGNTGTSVDHENTVYFTADKFKYPFPEASASWIHVDNLASTVFSHSSGKDISHIIYCSAPNPVTPPTRVTPADPTFTDAVCTGPGTSSGASYTIPATTGVQYRQSSDGSTFTDVSTGLHAVTGTVTIWVKPVALSGYVLSSSSTFGPHTFTSAGDCVPVTPPTTVTPRTPEFVDGSCSGPGDFPGMITPVGYWIPGTTGVQYQVSFDGITFENVSGGFHQAVVGSTIVVKPVALSGFVLSSSSTFGPHTFTSEGDCLVTAIPADPTFTDAACTGPGTSSPASYSIPETTGVQYQVSTDDSAFADVTAGSHLAVVGSTIVVKPVALDGFVLSSSSTFGPHTFTSAGDCGDLQTFPLVTPIVTSVDRTCTANGSYTLTAVEGVVYTVNGTVQAPGIYAVSTAKTVNVVASTISSHFGFGEGVQTSWNLVFTDPSNCGELKTLAFTGSNGTLAGGLLLGLIFMMLGASAITVSRVRKRTS